jgi:hypothetical protein
MAGLRAAPTSGFKLGSLGLGMTPRTAADTLDGLARRRSRYGRKTDFRPIKAGKGRRTDKWSDSDSDGLGGVSQEKAVRESLRSAIITAARHGVQIGTEIGTEAAPPG